MNDGQIYVTLARPRRDAIGFVFQAFQLMDELTAVENVELPALLTGRSPRCRAPSSASHLATRHPPGEILRSETRLAPTGN